MFRASWTKSASLNLLTNIAESYSAGSASNGLASRPEASGLTAIPQAV